MTSFKSRDDVLTVLIHLGYLAYDRDKREAYIPNEEVRMAFADAVRGTDWTPVVRAIQQSDRLLKSTWARDADAVNDYTIIRELPSGKGYADIVFLPRKHSDKPAMVVELKYNQSAESAIAQIKEKRYPKALEDYGGSLLLVGINYDKVKKEHSCVIEEWIKE